MKLLILDEGTAVYPGHGDDTNIKEAKRQYEIFASKPHPDDLCGDVAWLE